MEHEGWPRREDVQMRIRTIGVFTPAMALLLGVAFLNPAQAAPAGTPAFLALDADGFSGAADLERPGMAYYHDGASDGRNDFALGIHPATGGGYWLLGDHVDVVNGPIPTNTVLMSKLNDDGSLDPSFGNAGQATFDVLGPGGNGVAVATEGDDDRFYFSGQVHRSGDPNLYDPGISCAHANGDPCEGFGDAGTVVFPITEAAFTQAGALLVDAETNRIIMVGGCKATGIADPNGDLDLCIVALDADSGQPAAGFGNNGLSRVHFNVVQDGWDVLAAGGSAIVTDSSAPGGHRIYLVGGTQVTPYAPNNPFAFVDDRAFVMALDADTGAPDPTFGPNGNGAMVVFDDDTVSITMAITQLANGNLAWAGTRILSDGSSGWIVAELQPEGMPVPGFCSGEVCQDPPPGIGTSGLPRIIAERPGTGDLIIAGETQLEGSTTNTQAIAEMSPSGDAWLAALPLDYGAAEGQAATGSVKGMLVEDSGRVLIAGERLWTFDDSSPIAQYDITLARTIDTQDVFANGFDGR
jgi:hypothetical protein